jgi:uncharacterized protein involved in exopolysaccharide biosynthesis
MKMGGDMNERAIGLPLVKESSDISVRDVLTPLFRWKRFLVITFFSVVGAVILLAALMGPSYTSHMSILVNRERLDPLVTPESTTQMVTNETPITDEEINSELELLSSRDVLEQVAIANGLDRPAQGWSLGDLIHPHQTREDRIARAVKRLAKSIKAEVVTKTNLIEVKYSSSDPQLSYGVLKSLGEFYTQKHVEVHRPAGSYSFFAGETQRYHDALEQAEAKLRAFATSRQVAAPDAQEANLAQQVATSIGLMHLAEQSLAGDEERLKDDRLQMSKTPRRSPRLQTSAAADKLLDQLNANLLVAQNRRTELSTRYDPGYPLVQDVDQQIAQINTAIAEAEKTRYTSESTDLDPTFEVLREDHAKTRADRAAQVANLAATKRSIKDMQAQLVDLDRQSIARQDLDTSRIANVAIAVPPVIPVLPVFSWPLVVFAALCLGTLASIGGAYAVDYLDSSFRTPAQLTEALGIPVVVVFPKRIA